jgi:CRISPR/Cas system-associated endonuclease/helicase Cas3
MVDFTTNNFYEFENSAEMRQALTDDKERLEKQIDFIIKQSKQSNCLLVLTDRVEETQNFFEKLSQREDIFVFTMNGSTDDKTDTQNVDFAKIC